jgi:hypothetical protein
MCIFLEKILKRRGSNLATCTPRTRQLDTNSFCKTGSTRTWNQNISSHPATAQPAGSRSMVNCTGESPLPATTMAAAESSSAAAAVPDSDSDYECPERHRGRPPSTTPTRTPTPSANALVPGAWPRAWLRGQAQGVHTLLLAKVRPASWCGDASGFQHQCKFPTDYFLHEQSTRCVYQILHWFGNLCLQTGYHRNQSS